MTSFRLASGTGLLDVVEAGGRVARLAPDRGGSNLLWQGDAGAPLTGGDRLWLAPERDLMYRGDPSVRDNWHCPEELDPGSWEASVADGTVSLRQHALGAEMHRTVEAIEEPPVAVDLPWAGYRVHDRVETERAHSGWHVTMVSSPAELYVRGAREPVEYFGAAPSLHGGWVQAGGAREWKLGFRPPADGRIILAALSPEDPGSLVAVAALAGPDGTYVDVPPSGSGPGTAVQIYGSAGLGFAELEHHFPLESRSATATVLGVIGSRADRLEVLERFSAADLHGPVGTGPA